MNLVNGGPVEMILSPDPLPMQEILTIEHNKLKKNWKRQMKENLVKENQNQKEEVE